MRVVSVLLLGNQTVTGLQPALLRSPCHASATYSNVGLPACRTGGMAGSLFCILIPDEVELDTYSSSQILLGICVACRQQKSAKKL